ncbi:hypothetical protein CERSUDRAFT_127251 [Gelatoporia subvermispora B]|uniref:phospholipase D n=1 Tax=Ceriporiopsis subvermispora (strain B) TaxID=914234 RepID=M2QYS5_CERS8|nr:hypothetical protein CERSUDRAFT_127251 [Gelatoporia subvermispora B]
MYAVSELLENAREAIFILDWWLTPELYLRRPPALNQEGRLNKVLKRKAEQGVRVYVVVYKEVTQTMSMSSSHTKHALEALHPNIACMRHPDHIGSKDNVEFWSHHEKLVVVDNHFARDDHTLFPGQDYNNARIMDFKDVWNYHFVERRNEIKRRKYRHETRYDWLALPHDIQSSPNEAVARHPYREQWHRIGRHFKQRFHRHFGHVVDYEDPDYNEEGYPGPSRGTCRVQAIRSVSDWSHGILSEHSIQNAYIQLIQEAQHYIYIENQFFISSTRSDDVVKNQIAKALTEQNQFFISSTRSDDVVKNQIAKALTERIIRAAQEGRKFQVVIVIPEVPGFAGPVKDDSAVKTIMAAQYRTLNRGDHSIYEEVRKQGYEPVDYIRFFHLRAYDRINAPLTSVISKMEEKSGVKFHEAMTALARLWIGRSEGPEDPTDVAVAIPTVKFLAQRTPAGANTELKTETYKLPRTLEEARDLIQQFERGSESLRDDEAVSDNVVQHMLHDKTNLLDEKWLRTEEEERAAYVSELLYIHSKVMIVDEQRVIMGSANINDRSQKGDGDSEIALVIEDDNIIDSQMNGKPWLASRFAATLRRKLYRGPLADATLDLWNSTAKRNRDVFTEIFRPVPTNLVRTWEQYDNYVPKAITGLRPCRAGGPARTGEGPASRTSSLTRRTCGGY